MLSRRLRTNKIVVDKETITPKPSLEGRGTTVVAMFACELAGLPCGLSVADGVGVLFAKVLLYDFALSSPQRVILSGVTTHGFY